MGTELSMSSELQYDHWGTVIFYSLLWISAALVLIRPRTLRERCIFAVFAVFILDEFIELYGLPFTLALFSDWLSHYPTADLLSHRAGDLWRILLRMDDRYEVLDLFHLIGGVLIFAGLGLLFYASMVLKDAHASGVPATTGPYAWIRHPQYLALFLMMLGFVVQGPTLPTLVMFPILVYLYALLARHEEREALSKYGQAYAIYMKRTPAFI